MIQKSISFDDVTVVTVRGNYYKTNFWFVTKNGAADGMKNTDLSEKYGQL